MQFSNDRTKAIQSYQINLTGLYCGVILVTSTNKGV